MYNASADKQHLVQSLSDENIAQFLLYAQDRQPAAYICQFNNVLTYPSQEAVRWRGQRTCPPPLLPPHLTLRCHCLLPTASLPL